MLLSLLSFIAITLLAIGYWVRRPAIGIASGVFWLLVAGESFTMSTAAWDVYFAFYVVAIGLGIVAFLEGFVLKPKEDTKDQMMDDDSDWKAWNEGQKNFQESINLRKIKKPPVYRN